MKTLAEVGEAVAKLRREAGITQEALAEASGTRQSYWSLLERGHVAEFGLRKLLSGLDLLGYEIILRPIAAAPTLEDLLAERRGGGSS